MTYERPMVRKLGSVRDLTLQAGPPGKQGSTHDSSQFQLNFSCVGGGGSCGGDA